MPTGPRTRFSLGPALIVAGLTIALAAAGADEVLPGPYEAELLEVVDGDTIRARIRVWVEIEADTLVRIDGIDTPELRGACEEEVRLARRARDRVVAIAAEGGLMLYDVRYGKYAGRVIARVEAAGRDIGATLQAEGLARPYSGRRRAGWCD